MKRWLIIVIVVMVILLIALQFIDPDNHPIAFTVIVSIEVILTYILSIRFWWSNRRKKK